MLISLERISLVVLSSQNNILLEEQIEIKSFSIGESLKFIENFLDKNILKIEKILKEHVKNIIVIFDDGTSYTVDISFSYNTKKKILDINDLTNSLVEIKDNFIKTTVNIEIIHMMINKIMADDKFLSSIPKEHIYDKLHIELRFICLKIEIFQNLKKILLKYQISLDNTLCGKYVRSYKNLNENNIFIKSQKILDGHNKNEIFLTNRSERNKGFFEKFFGLFK